MRLWAVPLVLCAASCSVSTSQAPVAARDGGGTADPWSDANPGGNGGEFSDTDMNCGGQAFAISRVPPNVMLVLDRSGSMDRTISRSIRNTAWSSSTWLGTIQ